MNDYNFEYKKIKSFKLDNNIYSCDINMFYTNDNAYIISNEGISLFLTKKYKDELLSIDLSDELKYKLLLKGFINNKKRFNSFHDDIIIGNFIILITDKCNFNCTYCYRNLDKKGTNITKEELIPILDFLINYSKKKKIPIIVQPFGGEPLLAYDLILFMDDYFKERKANISITLQTNGSLITENKVIEFKKRNINVGVSIDGIDIVHNKNRKDVLGNDTYQDVKEGIKHLKKYFNNISSISVVSKYSLNYIYDSLNELSNMGINSYKLNLLYLDKETKNLNLMLDKSDIKTFIDNTIGSIIKLNSNGKNIIEYNIYAKILNLVKGFNHNLCNSDGCLALSNIVSIDRKGNIYPCKMINEDMIVGSIYDDIESKAKEFLNKHELFNKKKCHDCIWQCFCKGGCKSKMFDLQTDIDELECEINKYLYPKLINYFLNDFNVIKLLTNNKIELGG